METKTITQMQLLGIFSDPIGFGSRALDGGVFGRPRLQKTCCKRSRRPFEASPRPDEPAPAPASSGPAATKTPSTAPLGDEKWWEVFQDKELQELIRIALKNNYDVRIAATRVLQAQAQLGITRADQLPSLNVGGNVTGNQNPKIGPIPAYQLTQGEVSASAAWNVDFWGRYRRATEAARANLLSSEWAQKEVVSTLVANVASSYFVLRQLDYQLEISKRTLSSRQDSSN